MNRFLVSRVRRNEFFTAFSQHFHPFLVDFASLISTIDSYFLLSHNERLKKHNLWNTFGLQRVQKSKNSNPFEKPAHDVIVMRKPQNKRRHFSIKKILTRPQEFLVIVFFFGKQLNMIHTTIIQ